MACIACFGWSPSSPDTQTVRLATWNLHDFFRSGGVSGEQRGPTDDYRQRLRDVGSVLSAIDPDVVVLQEIESPDVLADLAESAGAYRSWWLPGNDPRNIHLGLLSRAAPESISSHRDDTFDPEGMPVGAGVAGAMRYARDCLEVRFGGKTPWVLLGVHFKSKAEPDDPVRRLAEARHTRFIADSCGACARVAIAGDVNDLPGSPAVEALRGKPPRYRDAADEMAGAWTYEYAGERQLIDHVFSSPRLASEVVPGSVSIDHSSRASAASDHAPLVVSYQMQGD